MVVVIGVASWLPIVTRIQPVYWVVEGFGLWGVMLFFMLSGYLLADTFWRSEPADLRVYAIRRFFRIAPAYYVSLALLFLFFAGHRLVFSEQGAKQLLANATFTHYLFPDYSQLAQRQRRPVDADHRDAALRLPAADGAAGPVQPVARHRAS